MAALVVLFLGISSSGATAAPPLAISQVRCAPCATGITLIDPSGTKPRVLTRHPGWIDSGPAWSPDGKQIAFSRSTNGGRSFQVYIIRADGRNAHRITGGRFDDRPAWSPSGRWIAYQALDGVIRLVHPDGSGNHAVPGTNQASWPAWSPDGKRLAFTQGGYVVTTATNGAARRRIVRGREPDWSPDGQTIAYTGPDGGVFTVGAAGGRGRMLHSGMQPAWSPDGKKIAFTRWPQIGPFSVWVMNADGSGARRLFVNAYTPAWRP